MQLLRSMAPTGSLLGRLRRLVSVVVLLAACADAAAQKKPEVDALHDAFPSGSIDSIAKADAALAATSGAKAAVEKDFRATGRACIGKLLVNRCLDDARAVRRRRMADIDAVELEANRFKRRDKADRIEADRARREAERAANAQADAATRERNRKSYTDRQAEAARSVADRAKSETQRAGSAAGHPHNPVVKTSAPSNLANDPAKRDKNAADFAAHTKAAQEHDADLQRRLVEKTADRKRRAEAKAVKDAKTAAAANAGAATTTP